MIRFLDETQTMWVTQDEEGYWRFRVSFPGGEVLTWEDEWTTEEEAVSAATDFCERIVVQLLKVKGEVK